MPKGKRHGLEVYFIPLMQVASWPLCFKKKKNKMQTACTGPNTPCPSPHRPCAPLSHSVELSVHCGKSMCKAPLREQQGYLAGCGLQTSRCPAAFRSSGFLQVRAAVPRLCSCSFVNHHCPKSEKFTPPLTAVCTYDRHDLR
jgi:hypothetical protein